MARDSIAADEGWWVAFRKVEGRVRQWLTAIGSHPVHALHFVPISPIASEVYVFFETDQDLAEERGAARLNVIESRISDEFGSLGYGPATGVSIRVEFDSHENVVKNYRGNYFLRLR